MELTSLGYRTDLMMLAMQGGEIHDRGDHLVVRTPAQPLFHWAMTFGLDTTDGTTGDLSGFVEAGITAELSVVLTAHDLHPQPCPNAEARLRTLASDDDWAQAVDLRMGLDDTLVHHAVRYALTDLGVETLVIVADPEYVATRIYRSVGFDGTETQVQLSRS